MSKKLLLSVILLLVSIAVLLFTLVRLKNEPILIPFSTLTGESGSIEIEIPSNVWVGDRFTVVMRIVFDTLPDFESPILIGRLETGMEESTPRGEVMLGLDTKTPVVFEWTLRSYQEVEYPGILWLWVETGGEENLLLSREFSIEAQEFLGIKILNVRIAACLVALAALMVVVYFFLREKR